MRASVAFVLGIIWVLIVSCEWSVAEPGNDVAHLSFAPLRCPRGCTCSGTITDCSHRGFTQVPKNVPPETERLDNESLNVSEVDTTIHLIEDEIRENLDIHLPTYLKNVLIYTGFDNSAALSELDAKDIVRMECFVRNELQDILSKRENVQFEDFYGIYVNNRCLFQILPGHKKLLMEIQKFYKDHKMEYRLIGSVTDEKMYGEDTERNVTGERRGADGNLKPSTSGGTEQNRSRSRSRKKKRRDADSGGEKNPDAKGCVPDHCVPPNDEDRGMFGIRFPLFPRV